MRNKKNVVSSIYMDQKKQTLFITNSKLSIMTYFKNLKLALAILLPSFFIFSQAYSQDAAFLLSNANNVWGTSCTNQINANLDLGVGVGGWAFYNYESVNVTTLLADHCFLYLEGGDDNANELAAFLNANLPAIESWVASGNTLFLNAAPNEGGNINFGFGGVILDYPIYINNVIASDPSHPIFNGPNSPVAISYSGNHFGHAIICPAGLPATPLIEDSNNTNNHLLVEATWGAGTVLFGGMTATCWHSPNTEANNLQANIFNYMANVCSSCVSNAELETSESYEMSDFCTFVKYANVEVTNANAVTAPITYSWSDGSTGSSIAVTAAGTYTVVVTDGDGCTATEDVVVDNTFDFDVIGNDFVYLRNSSIETNSLVVGGNVTNLGRLRINSSVDGALIAPRTFVDATSSVGSLTEKQVGLVMPPFIENDHMCPVSNVIVPANGSMTLTGDAYNLITIMDGATLTIDSPIFYAETIFTRKDVTIIFTQPTTVVLGYNLTLGANSTVNAGGQQVIFYVENDARFAYGSDFTGNVYAMGHIIANGLSNSISVLNGRFLAGGGVNGTQYAEFHPTAWCYTGSTAQPCPPQPYVVNDNPFENYFDQSTVEDFSISLSPNPAINAVNVHVLGGQDGYNLSMFNQMGRLIWQSEGTSYDEIMNIDLTKMDVASGIYFIKVQTESETEVKQLSILR